MPRHSKVRAGILIAILPWFAVSCGTKIATQPGLSELVTSVPAPEEYLTSPQQEHRELLVDGRPTPIEWNVSGNPTYTVMRGINGGGDFILGIRSLWTYTRFNENAAIYFLLQWPDPSQSVLETPIMNDSIDTFDDLGNLLIDCRAGDDKMFRPTSWHIDPSLHEDQVVVEIFSDSLGDYPADNWRWGAATTDPVFPSSTVEFLGAAADGDSTGQFTHPAAGFMEDRFDPGGGPVDDQGRLTFFQNYTQFPNGVVPNFIAGKGTRDTRLNRGKPTAYTIWSYVNKRFQDCSDSLNPVRIDDTSIRDKSWNPGDYVPSSELIFPTLSQKDVLARGSWATGKWNLEIRRELKTYDKRADVNGNNPSLWIPWSDDVPLVPGRRYMMRVTVYDASRIRASQSAMLPLYLKPR